MQAFQFLQQETERQKGTLFLWMPVAMGVGVAIYFGLPFEPDLWWGCVAVSFWGCLFFLRRYEVLRNAVMLLAVCSLGFSLAILRTWSGYTPLLERELKAVSVIGTIESLEFLEDGKGLRAVLNALEIEDVPPERTPRKVRLKLRPDDNLQVGQKIQVLAGLNPPSPPVVPGGFDFQRHSFFQGLGAIGFAYTKATIVSDAEQGSLQSRVEALRFEIAKRVSAAMPARHAAIANALITGPRAAIGEEDNNAIRDAGLAHMLSISGMHISMLFGVVFFLVRFGLALIPPLALRYNSKKIAAIFAMGGALFYALISGGSIPTLRSVLMMGVIFLAIMLDRKPFSMRVVAFAALVVLAFSPDSLLGASFQLSFAAVAALIAYYESLEPHASRWFRDGGWVKRAGLYIFGIAMTSIVATFATAPLTLFHFQQIPVYSVVGNVFAVPVLGFVVMPFALVSLLVMPVGLQALPLMVVDFGVELILSISYWVSLLEGAVFRVSLWPWQSLPFFAVAFIIILLVRGWLKLLAFLPFAAASILIGMQQPPDILVSDNSKLFSIRVHDGLAFSELRKEKFVQEQFLKAYGLDDDQKTAWPKEGAIEDLRCDEHACRFERRGYKISFLRSSGATSEECAWADILISEKPSVNCAGIQIIGRQETSKFGAHSVTLRHGFYEIHSVKEGSAPRPWNAKWKR